MDKNKDKIIMKSRNSKAHLEYSIDYEVEGGIVLKSDEVKSIRSSSPSLQASYCFISKKEIYIKHLSLSKAKDPERDKKILLHRKQINKLIGLLSQKCFIIIPIALYEKNGMFKLTIIAGKALKKVDKREAIKEKEMKSKIHEYI